MALPTKRDVVLLVEDQVVDTGLDGRVVVLAAIGLAQLIPAPDRAVDHVGRAASLSADLLDFRHHKRFGQVGNPNGRDALRE